ASEVSVALWFAGQPLPFGDAMVIESFVYAVRTTAFVVPNSIGVQEGAYILLGGAFGLSPEMALALSLLKRARDLTIGLPAIALWQAIEGGRLMRRLSRKAVAEPARGRKQDKSPHHLCRSGSELVCCKTWCNLRGQCTRYATAP